MTTLAGLRKRIHKLEAASDSETVKFWMPDGTVHTMRSKRVWELCSEAIYGNESNEVQVLLTAVRNDCDHRCIELLKMCVE